MEKLLAALTFPADKMNHFIVAAFLALAMTVAGVKVFGLALWFACMMATWSVALLATAKELYDYEHPEQHTADIIDALVSIGGALFVDACVYVGHVLR
jgi:hypothetical protein